MSYLLTLGSSKAALLLGLLVAPFTAQAVLPSAPLPIGRPDLQETRTIRELRPGLTHVHIERGDWPKDGPPKIVLESPHTLDRAELNLFEKTLTEAGYVVREHKFESPLGIHYRLFAGEFETREEARQAARKLPIPVGVNIPVHFPDWDHGPWSIDIVVVDPKKYRGKVINEWSRTALRQTPLEVARRRNAVVATNAAFFEHSIDEVAGVPTGVSITEGKWHHEPRDESESVWRSSIYLENKGNGEIEVFIHKITPFPLPVFKWAGGKKSITIDGIDRMPEPGGNELVAMSQMVAESAPLSHGTHKIPLLQKQIGEDGYLYDGYFIESGGPLLLATGNKQAILKEAAKSGPVELDLNVPGRPGLNAWLATPALIKEGQLASMPDPFYHIDFHTRTSLGQDADGKVYLIYVDGTSLNRMVSHGGRFGVTLNQLQKIANHLGLVNAANLDGGVFSSIMVIDGKVLGQDAEFHARSPYDDDRWVGDMVLIVDDEN